MRGAKPKPTKLKLIEGNRDRMHRAGPEPLPSGDLGDPPGWMTESQQDGWRYAMAHAPAGLLKMLDQSALVVWVIAEDMHREATRVVSSTGMLIKSKNQQVPMQNPYLAIINRQAGIMMKAAAELGFTPTSRSRIALDVGTKGKANAFDKFGD